MAFKAFGHTIIIKPLYDGEYQQLKSGLLIKADDDTDPVGRGIVVSVGDEVDKAIEEGAVLIFERGRHWDIEIEGEKLAYVEDEYALGVMSLDYYKKHVGPVTTTESESNSAGESTS